MGDVMFFYDTQGRLIRREDTRSDDEVLSQNLARIEAALAAAINTPIDYNGRPLQIRDQDRANLDGAAADALAVKLGVGRWNPQAIWTMADDLPMAVPTPEAQLALGQAAKAAFLALMIRKWTARAAILAALQAGGRSAADAVTF